MIRVTERVCRTAAGRLVGEDDPDAAFLAYAADAEVPDGEALASGLAAFLDAGGRGQPGLGAKSKPRPQDKARAKPGGDKRTPGPEPKDAGAVAGQAPVSGLTINRLSDKE